MKLLAVAALAVLSLAEAATRVAVIEVGAGGTVRRTNDKTADTSVDGIASFWAALHNPGRKLQHAGMTVVPDIFRAPSDGLVVGIRNVDLDTMPNVNALLTQEGQSGVVGHMEVDDAVESRLMDKLDDVENVRHSELTSAATQHCKKAGVSGIRTEASTNNSAELDSSVVAMINELHRLADAESQTFVLHLVVEEDNGSARRRRLARRLNEEEEGEEQGEENRDEENQGNWNNANGYSNNNAYTYGYYNDYNEWVTPWKTMFQIQYFNVVLWTSLGLVGLLFFTIGLMLNMPLMEDTLLFGQAAKMTIED